MFQSYPVFSALLCRLIYKREKFVSKFLKFKHNREENVLSQKQKTNLQNFCLAAPCAAPMCHCNLVLASKRNLFQPKIIQFKVCSVSCLHYLSCSSCYVYLCYFLLQILKSSAWQKICAIFSPPTSLPLCGTVHEIGTYLSTEVHLLNL